MSHLQYFSYPGFGEEKREEIWYSQAVRIGDRIEISGQGIFTNYLPTSTSRLHVAYSLNHFLRRLGPHHKRNPHLHRL